MADDRFRFSRLVLVGLTLWGFGHLAGGHRASSTAGDRILYNAVLPRWFHFDNVVHFVGFGTAGLALWEALRAKWLAGVEVGPGRPRSSSSPSSAPGWGRSTRCSSSPTPSPSPTPRSAATRTPAATWWPTSSAASPPASTRSAATRPGHEAPAVRRPPWQVHRAVDTTRPVTPSAGGLLAVRQLPLVPVTDRDALVREPAGRGGHRGGRTPPPGPGPVAAGAGRRARDRGRHRGRAGRASGGWRSTSPSQVLALIGLAFLLFLAGLEIDVAKLRGPILKTAGAGFGLTLLLGVAVGPGVRRRRVGEVAAAHRRRPVGHVAWAGRPRPEGRGPGRPARRAADHRRGVGGRLRGRRPAVAAVLRERGRRGREARPAGDVRGAGGRDRGRPGPAGADHAPRRGHRPPAGHHRRDPGAVRRAAPRRVRGPGRPAGPGDDPGRLPRRRHPEHGRPGHRHPPQLPR